MVILVDVLLLAASGLLGDLQVCSVEREVQTSKSAWAQVEIRREKASHSSYCFLLSCDYLSRALKFNTQLGMHIYSYMYLHNNN